MLRALIAQCLIAVPAVFVVVDPISAVPFFIAMTKNDPPAKRQAMARRAALVAFSLLTFFAFCGAFLIRVLGISMGAFKIAGGVLLLILAIDMLRIRPSPARITPDEVEEGAEKDDVAIVPLATPLLAGPGSIATVVVLMGQARLGSLWQVVPVVIAILITAGASYLLFSGAARVHRFLGRTGMNLVERAAGLLLAALAIQFMVDGAANSMPLLLHGISRP
jgi:multiple antibiotic resistance protein